VGYAFPRQQHIAVEISFLLHTILLVTFPHCRHNSTSVTMSIKDSFPAGRALSLADYDNWMKKKGQFHEDTFNRITGEESDENTDEISSFASFASFKGPIPESDSKPSKPRRRNGKPFQLRHRNGKPRHGDGHGDGHDDGHDDGHNDSRNNNGHDDEDAAGFKDTETSAELDEEFGFQLHRTDFPDGAKPGEEEEEEEEVVPLEKGQTADRQEVAKRIWAETKLAQEHLPTDEELGILADLFLVDKSSLLDEEYEVSVPGFGTSSKPYAY
jgi:hypothetical protein